MKQLREYIMAEMEGGFYDTPTSIPYKITKERVSKSESPSFEIRGDFMCSEKVCHHRTEKGICTLKNPCSIGSSTGYYRSPTIQRVVEKSEDQSLDEIAEEIMKDSSENS